jgi:hypothetical protein
VISKIGELREERKKKLKWRGNFKEMVFFFPPVLLRVLSRWHPFYLSFLDTNLVRVDCVRNPLSNLLQSFFPSFIISFSAEKNS